MTLGHISSEEAIMEIPVIAQRMRKGEAVGLERGHVIGLAGEDSVVVRFKDKTESGAFRHEIFLEDESDEGFVDTMLGMGRFFDEGMRISLPGLGSAMIEVNGLANYGFVAEAIHDGDRTGRYAWQILSGHFGVSSSFGGAALEAFRAIQEVGK